MEQLKKIDYHRSIAPSVFMYVICFIMFSVILESQVLNVFFVTLPILLHIMMVFLREDVFLDTTLFWLSPLFIPIIFFLIWVSKIFPISNEIDGPVVFIIQVLYSYLILIMIYALGEKIKAKKKKAQRQLDGRIKAANQKSDYYLQLANDYYSYLEGYQHKIEKLQLEIQKMDELRRLANENASHSDHYKNMADEYAQKSDDYLQHIKDLKNQLENATRNNKSYKELVDEYEKRKKSYQGHIELLHQRLEQTKRQLTITKENFSISLRSIEDKCKAINFVIGRVYSNKKGGTKEIRDLLHINRELYNAFSDMTHNFTKENVQEFVRIISIIQRKLNLYTYPEKHVFNVQQGRIKLKRNTNGTDAILDVLANNDNDPVKDYYSEAKEICDKLVAYMTENY